MEETKDEFVHYFTDFFPDVQGAALVVGVPEDGQLLQVGLKRTWPEGHVQTLRSVVKKWRGRRSLSIDTITVTPYGAGQSLQPVYQPMFYQSYQPMFSAPRFSMRAGGC